MASSREKSAREFDRLVRVRGVHRRWQLPGVEQLDHPGHLALGGLQRDADLLVDLRRQLADRSGCRRSRRA